MADVGAGARGGSAARSGMHDSIGMAHGLAGWAHATEPRGTEACETSPAGVHARSLVSSIGL
jgi:hypothetical protein